MASRKMIARVLAPIFLVGAAALLFFFRMQPEAARSAAPGLPVLYAVPEFSLQDESGAVFTKAETAGKIWVIDFFFTSCPGPCPIMSAAFANLAAGLPRADVHFVSVTVDPGTDTPERLRAYGERYGADFSRWHFLTGPIEAINTLAEDGFKLGSAEQPIFHSTRFVLVDRAGWIRAYYTGIEPEDVAKLKKDIEGLLKEESS